MKKILTLSVLLLMLTGCFALPVEAPALPPPVFTPPEPRDFVTAYAARGDVLSYAGPTAFYMLVNERDIRFEEGGIPVADILVSVGDYVLEGDLIVSMGVADEQKEEVEELVDARRRLNMRIQQINQQHNLELELAELSGIPFDDRHFNDSRRALVAELAVINERLEYLFFDDEGLQLLAPMSGIITHVMTHFEGMRSTVGSRVATIADQFTAAFVLRSAEAADMRPGDIFEADIEGIMRTLVVVDPDEHGFTPRPEWPVVAYLLFYEDPLTLAPDTRGRVFVPFGEAHDVIYIPMSFLQQAGERTFVYVLIDEIQVLRDVEIGLIGNDTVEIRSGLAEGEVVLQ